jgi:hypothetical protein
MDVALSKTLALDERVLGEQERLLHHIHTLGGLIATTTLRIRGPLDMETLRRGLDWLQHRHGMLRAHIRWRGFDFTNKLPFMYRRYGFVQKGTTQIPLRLVDGDWQAVLQHVMRTRFPGGRSPRLRVTVVREAKDLHHIILASDHAIGDAQAALLSARDLMSFLEDPGAAPLAADSRLPPALESCFTPSSDPKRRYEPAMRLPIQRVKAPKETRFEKRWLDTAATDALRAAARAERTTVNGAVSAAVLRAVGKHFGLNAMTCLTNAELRKLMVPPLPVETYGCFIDAVRSTHRLDQTFWALAREVSFKLIATIARHQQQATVLTLPDFNRYRYETVPTVRSGFCLDGVGVTTGGETGLKRRYGALELEDVTICASLYPVGIGLYVVALEVQGRLQITLCYGARRIQGSDVAAIADLAVATLSQPPTD